jgi:microcystin-dependent protein
MDPFIGEIRAFAFTFAPYGWATCDGQIMNINQSTALFSIIGNVFGGDGKTTFALPNLSGRAPMDFGAGPGLTVRNWGDNVGETSVSLTTGNFPPHTHGMNAVSNSSAGLTAAANSYLSKGNYIAGGRQKPMASYNAPAAPPAQLAADAVTPAGTAVGTVPHNNMQPYLPVLLCIALQGIYPSRS